MDPATGQVISGDIKAQTVSSLQLSDVKELVLKNLTAVLAGAGTDLAHVVKTTVFLKDMNTFPQMNEVYSAVSFIYVK